jgi:hypothetical protein
VRLPGRQFQCGETAMAIGQRMQLRRQPAA